MKLLCLAPMLFTLSSCDLINRDAAEQAAKEYIADNLRELTGYDSLSLKRLDTLITSYTDVDAQVDRLISAADEKAKDLSENYALYRERELNGYYAKRKDADSLRRVDSLKGASDDEPRKKAISDR